MKKTRGGQKKTFSPIGPFCVIYKANSSAQSLICGDFPLPPLLRSTEAIAHQHTLDTQGELNCLIRDCFCFLKLPRRYSVHRPVFVLRHEGKDLGQKEAGSHGFLMSHVLTGMVVSCYRCVPDSLMRCRKFRRPKNSLNFLVTLVGSKPLVFHLASPNKGYVRCP